MKAKVIIENGETDIVLTPENKFEINLLDTILENKRKFNISTKIDADQRCGIYENRQIIINIKEEKQ